MKSARPFRCKSIKQKCQWSGKQMWMWFIWDSTEMVNCELWYNFDLNNGFCVWLDYNCDARLLDKMYQSHTCSAPPGVRLTIYSGAGRGSDVRMKWSENPNNVSVNDPVTGLATWYQVCWITQNIGHLLLVFRSFVCLWVCDGHLHFHWYEQ